MVNLVNPVLIAKHRWVSLHVRGVVCTRSAHHTTIQNLHEFSIIIHSIRFHKVYSIISWTLFNKRISQIILMCSDVTDVKKNRLNKFQLFKVMQLQWKKVWQHDYIKLLQQRSKRLCIIPTKFSMSGKIVIYKKTLQSLPWKQDCITERYCKKLNITRGMSLDVVVYWSESAFYLKVRIHLPRINLGKNLFVTFTDKFWW